MKIIQAKRFFLPLLAFPIVACAAHHGEDHSAEMATNHEGMVKSFPVITNDRSEIGTLMLSEVDGQVVLHVNVSGISPGKHGVHFHAVGDCSDEKFLNTTGHINPMGKAHGLNNPDGPDNADLTNLLADENGNVNQMLLSPRVSFYGTTMEQPALFDEDGSALVIHENEDDQITQPIGGAGARIGCAELK